MSKAGLNALKEEMKSYSSVQTMSTRFNQFVSYLKEQHGIKDMRHIELKHVQDYAALLKACVESGRYQAATAQNYLSAVNRVLVIARGDKQLQVDPVKNAGLAKRTQIATSNKALTNADEKLNAMPDRFKIVYQLAQQFGLRFEEAAKFDAQAALSEARIQNRLTISRGVKGGHHDRLIRGISGQQLRVLERAAGMQPPGQRSLIPSDQSYKAFRQEAQSYGVRFHAGRHEYAQSRYQALTGVACPVVSNMRHGVTHIRYVAAQLGIPERDARQLDVYARTVISEELGHHRTEITNNYLG